MVPLVISPGLWIVIMPLPIVDRNLHLGRISVVHVFAAAIVVRSPEVLRIIDIRVMVQPIPVLGAVTFTPLLAIGLLGLGISNASDGQ